MQIQIQIDTQTNTNIYPNTNTITDRFKLWSKNHLRMEVPWRTVPWRTVPWRHTWIDLMGLGRTSGWVANKWLRNTCCQWRNSERWDWMGTSGWCELIMRVFHIEPSHGYDYAGFKEIEINCQLFSIEIWNKKWWGGNMIHSNSIIMIMITIMMMVILLMMMIMMMRDRGGRRV